MKCIFVPVRSQFVGTLSEPQGYYVSGCIMLVSVHGLIVCNECGITTTDVV